MLPSVPDAPSAVPPEDGGRSASGRVTLGSSLLSATVLLTLGVLIQGVARFVYTTWVGNAQPTFLGEISALLSLSVYVTLFWSAPAGIAASRFLPAAQHDSLERAAIMRILNRGMVAFCGLAAVVAVPVAWWISKDIMTAALAALLVVSYGAYLFCRGVQIGDGRVLRATVFDAVSSLVVLLALAVVVIAHQPRLLLIPLSAGYAVFVLANMPRVGSALPHVPHELRTTVNRFTRHSILGLVAAGGLLPATMLTVQLFDAGRSSMYGACLTLATPANMIAQAFTQALIPHFATRSPEAARGEATRLMWQSTIGFVALFAMLTAAAPLMLDVFFPGKFLDGTATLRVLIIGVGILCILSVPSALLIATGRERIQALLSLVATLVGVGVMAASGPSLGTAGTLLGFLVGAVLSVALVGIAALRRRGPGATGSHLCASPDREPD